jgi:hypothetical protein
METEGFAFAIEKMQVSDDSKESSGTKKVLPVLLLKTPNRVIRIPGLSVVEKTVAFRDVAFEIGEVSEPGEALCWLQLTLLSLSRVKELDPRDYQRINGVVEPKIKSAELSRRFFCIHSR